MSPLAPPSIESSGEEIHISKFYKPWVKQIRFHTSNKKFRLQVGSYGSGKSRPLLMEGIFHAIEYPGSVSIILRKTVPDLKRTVIDKFLADIPADLYESYNQSDRIVYFHPVKVTDPETGEQRLVQSKLFFGACDSDKAVSKFLSTEFVFIGFEELGEFSFAIWDAFAGRNRCPIPGSRPCMAGATNPMGVGWGWIKRLWVDHIPAHGMNPEKYKPEDYEYVHSTVDDNPIYSKDQEYIDTLEASPLRDKIRWGKLESVSGQYFDNWEYQRHVQPASAFMFQPWQTFTIGWDYGFGHFATMIWLTKALLKPNPQFGWLTPRIVNVITRELWLHENTPKQQTEALVMSIPRQTDEEGGGYKEIVEGIHFSWERFNRTVSNFTVAMEVGDLLAAASLPRPQRSNTDRIAGYQKIYNLLDTDELFLLDTCPALAEALPLLVRDPIKLEDVLKPKGLSLNDDLGDGARYAIAGALLDEDDKPEDVKLKERLAKIEDPMRRQMEAYKAHIKQQSAQKQTRQVIIPSWMNRVKH